MIPWRRRVRRALVTDSREDPVHAASSSWVRGRVMRTPCSASAPNRSASSASRSATRPRASYVPNSTRLRSASRSRDTIIRTIRTAASGCVPRKSRNAVTPTTYASRGSRADTEAERGAPSSADISPSRAPGPRMASSTSPPCAVSENTLARPVSTSTTVVDRSPSLNRVAPAGQRRRRPIRNRSSRSPSVSRPTNSPGSVRVRRPGSGTTGPPLANRAARRRTPAGPAL